MEKNDNITKKHIIFFTILTICIVFLLFFKYKLNNINNNNNNNNNIVGENIQIYNESTVSDKLNETIEKEKQKIDLGIYVEENGIKTLITSHTTLWYPEEIMGVFYAIPSTDETLDKSISFDKLWKEKISTYDNYSNLRIGYNISFTLNTGETIYRVILNPDDAYYMFPKVMVFLYDDVNLVPGKKYYHITQDEMNENTICSSIKLVGDKETKNIVSDINLTAFCYDSKDDFDKNTGKYIRKFIL